jgi:16S rRNA processing protein RimM
MDLRRDRWVELAEITRAHGIRGEVRVRLFNPDSDVLLQLKEVRLRMTDGSERDAPIETVRPVDGGLLIKFRSVGDRDRADELRGVRLLAPRASFPPLDEGEFYVCDVIGANVYLLDQDAPIGTLADLRNYPTVDVLVVNRLDGAPVLEVPLTDAFVERVDAEAMRVVLRSLEGLDA